MKNLRTAFTASALAGALAFLSPAAAEAADIYRREPLRPVSVKDDAVPALPALTWSGFYIGAHLGGAFDDDDSDFKGPVNYVFDDDGDKNRLIGGVHAGYNWQRQALVLGLEGDVSFAENIDYLASIRGRLGLASSRILVYGTAGAAFLGYNEEFTVTDGVDTYKVSNSKDEIGFVVGGGGEVKLTPNVSLGLEALYYAFDGGDNKYNWKGSDFTVDDDLDFWTVRGRLTFHLNGK